MESKEDQLMKACYNDDLDEVKRLVDEEGVDVESKDEEGWTPLILAVAEGHVDVVRLLLDRGANINNRDDHDDHGSTALHHAACYGEDETVTLLIEKGADLHVIDDDGRTPLDDAKHPIRNHSSVVAILEAAMKSVKVIYTSSQDLQQNKVTFKESNNNIILISDNDIPDEYEFEGKPTFTLQHIRQLIDQLMAIDDDTSSNQQEHATDNLLAQHHPTMYKRMQYWGMNLLHLMVYFPQHSNNDHASLNSENGGDIDDKMQILSSLLDLYSPQAIASVDIHGMTPLHHATINSIRQKNIRQKMMSQECYELLLARSPSIVVHKAIQAGMDWNQLRPIIMAKLTALTVEDEETGLMPFMLTAEKYHKDEENGNADDMLLVSLNMAYELLCLQPDVLKEYDVSINTAKRSYKDMSGF